MPSARAAADGREVPATWPGSSLKPPAGTLVPDFPAPGPGERSVCCVRATESGVIWGEQQPRRTENAPQKALSGSAGSIAEGRAIDRWAGREIDNRTCGEHAEPHT